MPKNSIFDLADKFGHTSPFGDWLTEEKEERERRAKEQSKKQLPALAKKFKLSDQSNGYNDFIKMINETWFPTNWLQAELDRGNNLSLKVEPSKYGAAQWIPTFLTVQADKMDKAKFDLFFGTSTTEGVMKKLGKCTNEEVALAKYLYTEVIYHSNIGLATVEATLDDAIDAKIDSFSDARIFMKQMNLIKFTPTDKSLAHLLKKMQLLHFIEEQRYAQINLKLNRGTNGLEDLGSNDYQKSHLAAIDKTAELIDTTYDANSKQIEIPDPNPIINKATRFVKLRFDLIDKGRKAKFDYFVDIKFERIFNKENLTIEIRLIECSKISK